MRPPEHTCPRSYYYSATCDKIPTVITVTMWENGKAFSLIYEKLFGI